MRNPGLEPATRVAVRSYAPTVAIDARAASSVHSPPPCGPCGEGSGVGVVALVNRVATRITPLPNPPPPQVGLARLAQDNAQPGQAPVAWGREQTEFVAPTDPNS